MEEKLTGNELEMLYAAADYRRAEIVMNQYFDKVPGNVWHVNEFHHPAR